MDLGNKGDDYSMQDPSMAYSGKFKVVDIGAKSMLTLTDYVSCSISVNYFFA